MYCIYKEVNLPVFPRHVLERIMDMICDPGSRRAMASVSSQALLYCRPKMLNSLVFDTRLGAINSRKLRQLLDILEHRNFMAPYITSLNLRDHKQGGRSYEAVLETLLTTFPNLETLALSGISFPREARWVRKLARCPLQILHLEECGLNKTVLFDMLNSARVLEVFSFSSLTIPEFDSGLTDGVPPNYFLQQLGILKSTSPEVFQSYMDYYTDLVRLTVPNSTLKAVTIDKARKIGMSMPNIAFRLDIGDMQGKAVVPVIIAPGAKKVSSDTAIPADNLIPPPSTSILRSYAPLEFTHCFDSSGKSRVFGGAPPNPIIRTLRMGIMTESDHALLDILGSRAHAPRQLSLLHVTQGASSPALIHRISDLIESASNQAHEDGLDLWLEDLCPSLETIEQTQLPITKLGCFVFTIDIWEWRPYGNSAAWAVKLLESLQPDNTGILRDVEISFKNYSVGCPPAQPHQESWGPLQLAIKKVLSHSRIRINSAGVSTRTGQMDEFPITEGFFRKCLGIATDDWNWTSMDGGSQA